MALPNLPIVTTEFNKLFHSAATTTDGILLKVTTPEQPQGGYLYAEVSKEGTAGNYVPNAAITLYRVDGTVIDSYDGLSEWGNAVASWDHSAPAGDYYVHVVCTTESFDVAIYGWEGWNTNLYYDIYNHANALTAAQPVTIESLLNDSLTQLKTYVDSHDANIKTYADGLISQLMQTTDLSAKIALLNQVNEILDGDSATAGFQAWESSLTRLNQIVNDFEAFKISNSNVIANGLITVTNSLNAFKGSTDIAIAQLYGRADSLNLANEKTNVDMKSAFESMKVKTALLFAV